MDSIKLPLDRKIGGPLEEVSAVCMKHHPKQFHDFEARARLQRWIDGQ